MLRRVLTEIDLTLYPKVSLVIFLIVFGMICWSVWTLNRRLNVSAVAHLPLDDTPVSPASDTKEATR